jgi:structural maintenance of chromosome 1
MPVSYLELENFKSYAGFQRIGPFKDFTSIIGPNGSGKSNLMDAISFVLGVQSRDLRSSQLKDLIFRPPEAATAQQLEESDDSIMDGQDIEHDKPTAGRKGEQHLRASAALVYQDPDDPARETRFGRAISAKGVGEYRINNRAVTFAEYERELKAIGVLIAARNFLVFQGDVESLAQKTPKQLAQLMEQVSGSEELREEYEEALKAKCEAEAANMSLIHKVKALKSEAKELKKHKEEAQRFQSLVRDKTNLTTEFFLWQLYHIEMDISEKEDSKRQLLVDMAALRDTEANKADELRTAKKNASTARKAATIAEKKRLSAAAGVDTIQPSLIQITEEVKNLEHKVDADLKALETARREKDAHAEASRALEKEIEDYTETEEQLRAEYEQTKEEATSSATVLSEEQEAEYERIKDAAAVASVKARQILNTQVRKLESARVKAANLSDELKEAQARMDEATINVQNFTERRSKLDAVRPLGHLLRHLRFYSKP